MKFLTRRVNEWLIVISAFVLLTTTFSMWKYAIDLLPNALHYVFNPHPTTVILSINTTSAIEIFSGEDPLDYGYDFDWKTMSMLANIILYLMIAPYLLFKGYKKAEENEQYKKPWFWYLGGILFIGSLSIIPFEILHITVFEKTKEYALASKNIDMMRSELFDVGFATAQYEILENGLDNTFTIDELELKDLKFEYSIESIAADTLVRIIATSSEYKDHSVTAEVRPYKREQLKFINQNY